jgi:hypothetical protein
MNSFAVGRSATQGPALFASRIHPPVGHQTHNVYSPLRFGEGLGVRLRRN